MATQIEYRFQLPTGDERCFPMDFDEDFALASPPPIGTLWTALDFAKCRHCPLSADAHPHCPLALQLIPLLEFAAPLVSFQHARVEIRTPSRMFVLDGPIQRGLSSLMGLLIPASGCPRTAALRPLARTHLPNASRGETLLRVLGTFLLAAHLADPAISHPWPLLMRLYRDLHHLNECLAQRIRTACEKDSGPNALVILDAFTLFVPMEIEDSLGDVRPDLAPMIEAIRQLSASSADP